jgi:hypothetical protein
MGPREALEKIRALIADAMAAHDIETVRSVPSSRDAKRYRASNRNGYVAALPFDEGPLWQLAQGVLRRTMSTDFPPT